MKPEDAAVLESILRKLSATMVVLTNDANLAVRILAGQRESAAGTPGTYSRLANLVDDGRFLLRWKGRECSLGQTILYRLFRRLATSLNAYVSHDDLLEEVWGTTNRTSGAVRTAVWDLRRKLKAAGMEDLASSIDGDSDGHYRLRLDRLT